MRFETFELVRYGHFSDRRLLFPDAGKPDFHLILGRNEAGKSTLRQAFHDLLFGIPMTTPMSFKHAGTELTLAARLTGGPGTLEFSRRRKRNGGLADTHGEPLPADALREWLGDVTEAFYERMFGLDHRRLEQGGRAMLEAADNVDSVLFQAAAGVSALNDVLSSLRDEAAGLWTPRRSRDRAWYVAAARLADADAVLKSATVRPSAWAEAHRENSRLADALIRAESEHAQVLSKVRELERLRRVAPLMAQIRQCEQALASSDAQASTGPYKEYADSILELEDTRLRVANHNDNVQRCASRIELLWQQLAQVMRELGRPVGDFDEDALDSLTDQLPSRPLRREIEQLLAEGVQVRNEAETAGQTLIERETELRRLQNEMAALPAIAVGAALRAALDAVSAEGDIEARIDAADARLNSELEAFRQRFEALSRSGAPGAPKSAPEIVAWLAAMSPWQAATLVEQGQRRQRLEAEVDTLTERAREAELERDAAKLELEQFLRGREAVSRDEVVAARRERDLLWRDFSEGRVSIAQEGSRYVALVSNADALADRLLDAVGDVARLQALQHEHERRERSVNALHAARRAALEALDAFDTQWALECEQRRLPSFGPTELQGWLLLREAVLTAHERRQAAADEVQSISERKERLQRTLVDALRSEGDDAEPSIQTPTLAQLRVLAQSLVQRAEQADARRLALAEQASRVEALLPSLKESQARHSAQVEKWQRRWHEALQRAALAPDAQASYVREALTLLADADELAAELRTARAERERLANELNAFRVAAQNLATALNDSAFTIDAAEAHVRRWVTEVEQLRLRARNQEALRERLEGLNEQLLQEGEGRSRAVIESELGSVDVADLPQQAEALAAALEQAAAARSALAVESEQARMALEAISGGDEAAQAAARRQEALADMAEIAERYVRLHVEHRLLERVTEQYRERRQGPLLLRAGEIFADLTYGAHVGLVVDTDAASLHARRADGQLVPLDGLSDGTRDQLYLALRLAAVELYLDHAAPMPFIADDLFVNYDDQRAVAGLRNLGALATRTQVIFLTHHAHMVELAREALGQGLQLTEL